MGSQEFDSEGPSAFLIESGKLTVQPDGPIVITRAGTTTPVAVQKASQTELRAGDRGFAPSGTISTWRNTGTVPVRILEAKIKKGDVAARGDGVLNYTVIGGSPLVSPDRPIEMTVFQVTLQPGADLAADSIPGLDMLKVEAGRLVAVDVDGEGHPLPPVEPRPGQHGFSTHSYPAGSSAAAMTSRCPCWW